MQISSDLQTFVQYLKVSKFKEGNKVASIIQMSIIHSHSRIKE